MNILPENPKTRMWLFQITKYVTYAFLGYNGYMFYVDESAASGITFAGGMSLIEIIEVYSGSIDTTFWLLLVVLLELETYVIEDDVLNRPVVKWSLIFLRSICYFMIIYALYGYCVKFLFQADMVPFVVANICDAAYQNFSILLAVEDYIPLTAETCQNLVGADLYRLNGYDIIAPYDVLIYARNVSFIDVVNASNWLVIVAILEAEVWYLAKGQYTGRLFRVGYIFKIFLYAILFVCAAAWGYTGVFLDFSDAVVWLFAFFFIELNVIQWQEETEQEAEEAAADAATVPTG